MYTTYVTNERTKKKNDRTEEQGNERTNEPWSSKRRHHELFDFSSTPPPPPPSVPFQCSRLFPRLIPSRRSTPRANVVINIVWIKLHVGFFFRRPAVSLFDLIIFFVENKSIFSLLLKQGKLYPFTTFWMRRCEKRERLDRQNSSHYGLHQPFSSAIFKPGRLKDKTQLKLRFRTTVFCGLSWIKYLFSVEKNEISLC